MRITKLSLAGRGAWPDLHVEELSPQINVFFGKPATGKSTVAQLINHLLYGKADSPWRQQFGQTVPLTEGRLAIDCRLGRFVLRRHLDSDRTSRLTVAAEQGGVVDSRTVQRMLYDLSPQTLSQLMTVDFAEAPAVRWLLAKGFTRELAVLRDRTGQSNSTDAIRRTISSVDRQRVDELIRQRDAIAESIERQMAVRRCETDHLAQELRELEALLDQQRAAWDAAEADLHVVRGELTAIQSRLRYLSMAELARGETDSRHSERHSEQLAQLESEIKRCRQALADLQSRDAAIRAEMAQVSPDGTTERVGHLTDARTTIRTLERLVDDLDAEIALVARAHQADQCLSHDAHEKLSPVATMLRQQIYALCGLVAEQQRQTSRQRLSSEARQLARSQFDLSERLELLLEQRESLVHELSHADRVHLQRPQAPVRDLCTCEHHGRFLDSADPLLLANYCRTTVEAECRDRCQSLLAREERIQGEMDQLAHALDDSEAKWQQLQRQRAGLVGSRALEQQQYELEQLDIAIRQALEPVPTKEPDSPGVWRASDLLAKLSDGQYVQIRRGRQENELFVIENTGQAHLLDALPTAVHDQVYLALMLAMVGSFTRRGLHFPVVLDEPFLRQDSAQSAAMAGVLADVARSGQQLLVFTEDREALRRFGSLNCTSFDLAQLREQSTVATETSATTQTTFRRVVRETADGSRTPVLQIRADRAELDDQWYLTPESTLSEFPVLGGSTSEIFAHIGIHSVGELLAADPHAIASRLGRSDIAVETVRLWQSHTELMCGTPGLSLNDAQVLTACGVHNLDQLRAADIEKLEQRINGFLKSERGRRFAGSHRRFSGSQLRDWSHSAGNGRNRWSNQSDRRRGATRNPSPANRPNHRGDSQGTSRRSHRLRFYLSRESAVEEAPSIGPKTAEHLARVGIRTVADLLRADPESVSDELAISHITASKLIDWQHQARLVCQIPELRGYGAQLLVACELTTPEKIAATAADELVHTIQAFCQTKAGQRILRSGDGPSAAKIRRWVENAALRRPLEAA